MAQSTASTAVLQKWKLRNASKIADAIHVQIQPASPCRIRTKIKLLLKIHFLGLRTTLRPLLRFFCMIHCAFWGVGWICSLLQEPANSRSVGLPTHLSNALRILTSTWVFSCGICLRTGQIEGFGLNPPAHFDISLFLSHPATTGAQPSPSPLDWGRLR